MLLGMNEAKSDHAKVQRPVIYVLATPPLYSVLAPLCFVTSQGHRVPTKVAKHTVECLPYQFVRLHCGNPVKAGRQFLFHISNFLQAKALIFCSLVHKLAM